MVANISRDPNFSSLNEKIKQWRDTRTCIRGKPGAMPDDLWVEVIKMAKRYGTNPTSNMFNIRYDSIRKKLPGRKKSTSKPKPKKQTLTQNNFVEIDSALTSLANLPTQTVVELYQQNQLQIRLWLPRSCDFYTLAEFTKNLWGK